MELRRHWHGEVIPEAASTGDPQSNGAAERGVRIIKGAVRTLKDAFEYNFAHEGAIDSTATPDPEAPVVPPTGCLMTLMVKYAAASQRM